LIKIIAAAMAAGGAAYAVRLSFSETLPLITFNQVLAQGTLAGVAGVLAYGPTLYFMRSDDLMDFIHSFRKRLLKIGVLPRHWGGEELSHSNRI
jgi:hypothetical protein